MQPWLIIVSLSSEKLPWGFVANTASQQIAVVVNDAPEVLFRAQMQGVDAGGMHEPVFQDGEAV